MKGRTLALGVAMLLFTAAGTGSAFAAESAPLHKESAQPTGNVLSPQQAKSVIEKQARDVITAIKQRDMKKLSTYVHPEKGVRFSPYTYVDTKSDLVFQAGQLEKLLTDRKVYNWGTYDGSGEPIKMRFEDYYSAFVYDRDYAAPEAIGYNTKIGHSNTTDTIREVYPNAIVVEHHFAGSKKYEGMDWTSLKLVFQSKDNQWYLVGIVHDQWTI
jgi:hypothetical protein